MRALSVSAELKECRPRAPRFGSRTFISLCNLRNWAACGYRLASTLSRQSAYWGSTNLLVSLSDPPNPYPLRHNAPADDTNSAEHLPLSPVFLIPSGKGIGSP